MLCDYIDERYYKKEHPEEAFAENYQLIEELEALSEGIGADAAAGVAGFGGKIIYGVGKGVGKAGLGVGKGLGKFGAQVADKTVMNNQVGRTVKFQYERIRTVFKTVFKQVMKMVDNLINGIAGYEKRLGMMVNDINNALSKRHPNGEFPNSMKIITPQGLNTIGLDVEQQGSRASIANGYLTTVTQQSLLEGIHFGDEASEKQAVETLVERISGQKRPYDNLQPEEFRKMIQDNLYLFNGLNKDMNKRSANKYTKGAKDAAKGMMGMKQSASVDSAKINAARQDVQGSALADTLEQSLQVLSKTAQVFINLKAIDFLNKEKARLDDIGDEIDKLFAEKMKKELHDQETMNKAENIKSQQQAQQQTQQQQPQQSKDNNDQTSAQSAWDEKLFDSIKRAGYAEGIFKTNPQNSQSANVGGNDHPKVKPNPNFEADAYPTSEEMKKDHELLNVFITEYSKALTDTIQNIGAFYSNILDAGKATLTDYYKVTK